jgi:hypothetical protein
MQWQTAVSALTLPTRLRMNPDEHEDALARLNVIILLNDKSTGIAVFVL